MKNKTRIVDTHCHLEENNYGKDLVDIISRACNSGIYMINSVIHPDAWIRGLQISNNHDCVYLSVGLDPILHQHHNDLKKWIDEHVNGIIAIGEIGLDYYRERNHTQRELQLKAFIDLIRKAIGLNLPIQIHSRSSGKVCLDVLASQEASQVHMHAFDGKASLARTASREFGYYFSIPTSVVHSPQKRKLVKAVDIEHLLLETDSPVLSAERGERNEPSNITIALQEIATILRRDVEEMRMITLENTLRLYRKIHPN